ncbi:MAG: hypothetical protein HQK65_16260 [Desulfamplus sp.]|nr:hypothetical protein [Desulfamplus sp.]
MFKKVTVTVFTLFFLFVFIDSVKASDALVHSYVIIDQIAGRDEISINNFRLDFILPLLEDIKNHNRSKIIYFTEYSTYPTVTELANKKEKRDFENAVLYATKDKPKNFEGSPKTLIKLIAEAGEYGDIESLIAVVSPNELDDCQSFQHENWNLLKNHFQLRVNKLYFLSTGDRGMNQSVLNRNFLVHTFKKMGVKNVFFNNVSMPYQASMSLEQVMEKIAVGCGNSEIMELIVTLSFPNSKNKENDIDLYINHEKLSLSYKNRNNPLGEWQKDEYGHESIRVKVISDKIDQYQILIHQVRGSNNLKPLLKVTNSKGEILAQKYIKTTKNDLLWKGISLSLEKLIKAEKELTYIIDTDSI